jgi:tripartite-type tricarboxylate transporter receptor subunit TctC
MLRNDAFQPDLPSASAFGTVPSTRKKVREDFHMSWLRFAFAFLLTMGAWASCQADTADFYRGKTINIIIGYGPGGGYDIFARLLARWYGSHVPGKPSVIVQNMPGAASLRATNYIAQQAPKDGTYIAAFDRNMPLIAIIGGNPNVQFDPLKLTWLGTLSDSTEDAFNLFVRKRPDITTIEDLRKPNAPQITVGVTGAGATDHDITVLMRDVLGLNIRVVPGYPDSNTVSLAVENGELDGQFVNFVSTKVAHPAWIGPKSNMQVLMQFARKTRHPELPDVPTALELSKSADATKMIELAEIPYLIARPYAAPPDIPADRAKALQDAFMATARDPEFVAEVHKLNLELSPLDAEQALGVVKQLISFDQAQKDKLRDIMYGPTKN